VYFIVEGLSAYREIPWYQFEYFKGKIKTIVCLFFCLEYNIKFGHSVYIDKLLLTNPALFAKNHPHNKIKTQLFSNDLNVCLSSFKNIDINNINDSLINIKYPAVFYVGQPLSEYGIITEICENRVIDEIRNLCYMNNFNFYVKMHPREKLIKYRDHELILTAFPAEIIINHLNKEKIILCSPFSSVNFNFLGHCMLENIHLYKLFNISPTIPNLPINAIQSLTSLNDVMRRSALI
jgi:hypothetical protein